MKSVQELPLFSYAEKIIKLISHSDVVILSTPTGSGKTLLVPSFISQILEYRTFVTMPRVLLAKSAKKAVCEFVIPNKEKVGILTSKVKDFGKNKKLIFCTEGSFLHVNELETSDVIVIDEVHEQGINTELVLMKAYKHVEKGGRVVVMSATMDMTKYNNYFATLSDKVVNNFEMPEPKRPFETKEVEFDSEQDIIEAVADFDGNVLMGFAGKDEIQKAKSQIEKINIFAKVFELHAEIEEDDEEAMLSCVEPHIILATSVAMSGITFKDLDVVVPPAKGKRIENGKLNLYDLSVSEIKQWEGRVGRTKDGTIYKPANFYVGREINPMPEILRANLLETVLNFIFLGFNDFNTLNLLNKPSMIEIERSLKTLKDNGLVSESNELTNKGKFVIHQPFGIPESILLFNSKELGLENTGQKIAELIKFGSPYRKTDFYHILNKAMPSEDWMKDSEHLMYIMCIENDVKSHYNTNIQTIQETKDYCKLNDIFPKGVNKLLKIFRKIDEVTKNTSLLSKDNYFKLFDGWDMNIFEFNYNSKYNISLKTNYMSGNKLYANLSPIQLKSGRLAEIVTKLPDAK